MTADMDSEDSQVSVIIKRLITPLVQVEVEPVGQWFYAYEARRLRGHLISSTGDSEEEGDDDECPDVEIEDDIQFLRSLNPADWKNQDHYAVLGLKKYRYKASDDDIKKAYRIMVLRHHPDKRKGAGEEIREDDDYFTCITKAYEILGDPVKRRSWDSIDPEFNDEIPVVNAYSKANFFEVFGPAVERNARWSVRKHAPGIGKMDDSKEKVDRFYGFWYDFDSWREFSYLDEEEKEKGQDREERRWIEKQNKAERARRRKEEMGRLRRMIDNAYTCDPRIVRFKEEERERKAAQKKARADAIRQKQEEERRIRQEAEDAERKIKEAAEAEQKAKLDQEKKEREAVKKALKKERKNLRTVCKDHNYYASKDDDKVQIMTDVELLCEALELATIEDLNKELNRAGDDQAAGKEALKKEIDNVRNKIRREREGLIIAGKGGGSGSGDSSSNKAWSQDDLQLLIKGVNLFPAGTSKRWEVVAEYIMQHTTTNIKRTAKEVLAKAKELQHSDHQMREAANKQAYQSMEKSQAKPVISDATASQRFDTPQEMLGMNNTAWSPEEQRLLEQALKTYPVSTAERWDRIAECVKSRTKKECMRRYKELVEMVKAKKAAQAAAAKK